MTKITAPTTAEPTTVQAFLDQLKEVLDRLYQRHADWCSVTGALEVLNMDAREQANWISRVPSVPEEWLSEEGRAGLAQKHASTITELRSYLRERAIRVCEETGYATVDEVNEAFDALGIAPGIREEHRHLRTMRVDIYLASGEELTGRDLDLFREAMVAAVSATIKELGHTETQPAYCRTYGNSSRRRRIVDVPAEDASAA